MMKMKDGSVKAFASTVRGKGLLIALVSAGIGFQGCSSEESPAAPVSTETLSVDAPREDATGADLPADAPAQGVAEGNGAPAAPQALAKAAPNCLDLYQFRPDGALRYARVSNQCSSTQRFRLIWAWAPDGQCVTLSRGGTHVEGRVRYAYVTEVRGC